MHTQHQTHTHIDRVWGYYIYFSEAYDFFNIEWNSNFPSIPVVSLLKTMNDVRWTTKPVPSHASAVASIINCIIIIIRVEWLLPRLNLHFADKQHQQQQPDSCGAKISTATLKSLFVMSTFAKHRRTVDSGVIKSRFFLRHGGWFEFFFTVIKSCCFFPFAKMTIIIMNIVSGNHTARAHRQSHAQMHTEWHAQTFIRFPLSHTSSVHCSCRFPWNF